MTRKSIAMIVSFVLLATLLSLAIYADSYAGAYSNTAFAGVSTTNPADLMARATISSAHYIASDGDELIGTHASGLVYDYFLPYYVEWPPTASYAAAYIGEDEVAGDSWPD